MDWHFPANLATFRGTVFHSQVTLSRNNEKKWPSGLLPSSECKVAPLNRDFEASPYPFSFLSLPLSSFLFSSGLTLFPGRLLFVPCMATDKRRVLVRGDSGSILIHPQHPNGCILIQCHGRPVPVRLLA